MSVKPRRVLAYARVSSEEQALGSSLANQQDALRAYAAARGLSAPKFYVEAESAVAEKIELRVEMQHLMRDAREGDLVLCDKTDRWSRDNVFTHTSVQQLQKRGCTMFFVDENFDPHTKDGEFMLAMRAAFARQEGQRIRERTVGTRKILQSRGYYVEGQPPFGYERPARTGAKDTEHNALVIVPAEATIVRRIFAMCLAGEPLSAIAKELDITKDRARIAIRCRVYTGQVKTRDGWIKARHEAIVSAEVWSRANDALTKRRTGGPRPRGKATHTDGWFLRELVVCARCGSKCGAAWTASRNYYRCAHRCARPGKEKGSTAPNGSYVPMEATEHDVSQLISGRLAALCNELAKGPSKCKAPAKDFGTRRAALDKKRARFLETFAAGLVTMDVLRAHLERVDAERMRLDAEEGETKAAATPAQHREVFAVWTEITRKWSQSAPAERRAIARRLMTACAVAPGLPPAPAWRSVEELVRSAAAGAV